MKRINNRVLVAFLSLSLVVSIFSALGGFAVSANGTVGFKPVYTAENIVPGKIIVGLNEPFEGDLAELLSEVEIEDYDDIYLSVVSIAKKVKSDIKKSITDMIGTTFLVDLKEKSVDAVFDAVEVLASNDCVKYAEPDQYGDIDATIPNDLLFDYPDAIPQWGLQKIDAPDAWDYITGSDATDCYGSDCVKVAVLDTGVYSNHHDLAANLDMSLAYNAYEQTAGNVPDTHGHGTHVAGIIGAVGNNEIGVVGVCWNVDIVPIKISPYSGTSTTMDVITRAIAYVDSLDVPIANLSYSLSYDTALFTAIDNYCDDGGLLVKSAGNNINGGDDDDINPVFQALDAIDGVIIVGSLAYDMDNDVVYSTSNYGDTVVDLFAPGEEIRSTTPEHTYLYLTGTSMAAPFVTGTAALLKSANTSLANYEIVEAIVDNVVTSSSLTNYCSSGGRLSVSDALLSLGNQVVVSSTMTNGTVRLSAIFSEQNKIINMTVFPDAGYMLKPGTLKYNTSSPTLLYGRQYYFFMPSTDATITAQFYMIGDVDFDGSVTVTDALLVLNHASGGTPLTGDALVVADVDGDGDIDIVDAQTILSYAAHTINQFPIEV